MSEVSSAVVRESEIKYIGEVLEGLNFVDEEEIGKMRKGYPHLRFTLCSEDDIRVGREPYASFCGFDLHLVSSAEGRCSTLTFDLEQCTGIVVALHEE